MGRYRTRNTGDDYRDLILHTRISRNELNLILEIQEILNINMDYDKHSRTDIIIKGLELLKKTLKNGKAEDIDKA